MRKILSFFNKSKEQNTQTQTNKVINGKEQVSIDNAIDELSKGYKLLSNEDIGIQHYKEIEKIYNNNTTVLNMENERTGYPICDIFIFCIFHHTNKEKLRDAEFLDSLVKFLNDKKINNSMNRNEIIDFAYSNFLYLRNVRWRWFDEWRNIKLSIFENIVFTSADKGFYVTYTPNPENNIYEYKLSNTDDKLFNTIQYAGSTYQLNKNQTKKFVEYFDEINSRAEEKNKKVEELNRRAEELRIQEVNLQIAIENNVRNEMKKDYDLLISKVNSTSNEIKKLVYNFISHIPAELFISTKNYRLLEYIILRDSYLEEYVGNSHEERRRIIIEIGNAQSDLYNIILRFKEDKFDKLEKIIATKHDLEEHFSIAFMWLTLKEQLVDFFGGLWERDYGTYFSNEVIEFNDYVSKYFEIIEIDKRDESNIAMFTYFLMKRGALFKDVKNDFPDYYILIKQKVDEMSETIELRQFEQTLLNESENNSLTISDIDLLSGIEFEVIIANLFKGMGYATIQTKASGDQGIDLIVEKDGRKYGVQTKCYSNKVSNSAIQETVAGLAFYNCDKGIVVTNNYFTQSAIELARKNGVILWDRDTLKERLKSIK